MADGMAVAYHTVTTGGTGEVSFSNTINLPAPTALVAEICLSLFDTASASFGTPVSAFALFTGCTTDGSNPPLPPSETFPVGTTSSLSGMARSIVIRNGVTSISYNIDVVNATAYFVVNLFFYPAVDRGGL
jgi:hypothetical protein